MNAITIELCIEDRARIDRLIAALEKRVAQEEPITLSIPNPTDHEIQQALTKVLDNASKATETPQNAPQATEEPAEVETPIKEETPAQPAEAEPTITLEQIQQKVMALCTADKGKKKAKAREIVTAYSPTISGLVDFPDKWTEIWNQLLALESEK